MGVIRWLRRDALRLASRSCGYRGNWKVGEEVRNDAGAANQAAAAASFVSAGVSFITPAANNLARYSFSAAVSFE